MRQALEPWRRQTERDYCERLEALSKNKRYDFQQRGMRRLQFRRRRVMVKFSRAPCPLAQSGQQLEVGPAVVSRYAEGTGGMTKEVQDGQGKFPVAWGQWHWISLRSAPAGNR